MRSTGFFRAVFGSALFVALVGCQVDLAAPGDTRILCTTRDDCPSGWRCDELTSRCLGPDTPAPRCGDGVVDPGEECDCSESTVEFPTSCVGANSDSLPDRCRTDCTAHRCGDRVIDTAEQCDDGNDTPGDGCSRTCTAEICGNGHKDPGEACDEGPGVSGDGCSADCLSLETCGNGYVDLVKGEQCDCGDSAETLVDGCPAVNGDPDATCTANCMARYCGNGVIDPGEQCDDGMQCADRTTDCLTNGDCDQISGDDKTCQPRSEDGCSSDCRSNESCGNWIIDVDPGEECDDGKNCADVDHTPCTTDADCALVAGSDKSCVPRGGDSGHCSGDCHREVCGNERPDPGEVCDDGNFDPGDGCSAYCTSDESCGNDVVDFAVGELCDDGNARSHDGCSSACGVDLLTWSLLPTAPVPSARARMGIAYDSRRRRTVLFGGESGLFFNDTWEFDGTRWYRIETISRPVVRSGHQMVYDLARGRVVMFGGSDMYGHVLGDTWEYNGVDWIERHPAAAPGARAGHILAYDPARQKTVLFGGEGASGLLDDTWQYNGTTWTLVTPGAAPNPRSRSWAAAAYHPTRGKIVMFGGGIEGNDQLAETWEFDGTDWTVPSPLAGAPTKRARQSMVYVPAPIDAIVMFGGYDGGGGENNQTWEYGGVSATWTSRTTPAGLGTHAWQAAAYDAANGVMLMIGGWRTPNTYPADFWKYDSTRTWTSITLLPIEPNGRYRHAVAYDTSRRRMVLFGGDWGSPATSNDTWEFDGQNWFQMLPATPPSARRFHAMAYHADKAVMVMFGLAADTCTYDGVNWACSTPGTTPSARSAPAMTYDANRKRIVLFGGMTSVVNNETWEHDGTNWIPATPSPLPSQWPEARWYQAQAYDSTRHVVVMFGGVGAAAFLDDTWQWDGSSWIRLANGTIDGLPGGIAETPSEVGPRRLVGLAFDAARGRMVLTGGAPNYGAGGYTDIWELQPYHRTSDNTDRWRWVRIDILGEPPSTRTYAMFYAEPERDRLSLFGGNAYDAGFGGFQFTNETWILRYGSDNPDESCINGVDDDGDALVDCLDPDCADRNVCANPCRDGTAEQTFSVGVAGCSGTVTFPNRRTLCSPAARVCTAAEWFAYRSGTAPTYSYWTDDMLGYSGANGNCAAMIAGGIACASPSTSPIRVCAGATDPLGNVCNWTGCGFGANTPNDYFGGCDGNLTAGTLCCTR